MCPPAHHPPLSEIGLYWSDEQIIALLDGNMPGSHLPTNVLTDSNPYGYPPSNLPEGFWYLVHPNDKKDSIYGFWRAKTEASKIYSNSTITGWRTTLEYLEGKAPHGQRTDWLMQEYSVTQNGLCEKDMPKASRLLCTVFFCSGHSLKCEVQPQNSKVDAELKKISFVPSVDPNIISDQESRSESQGTVAREVGAVTEPADEKSNSSPPTLSYQECIRERDFLELDDLEDHSNSSSSQNSSCSSNLSDKCFDSLALLQEIEEDEKKRNQSKQSSSGYNFTSSIRANNVIFQPTSSVMSTRIELVDGPQTRVADKRVQDHTAEMHISDSGSEDTSMPSTSRKNATPSGRKKPASDRIKKLKIYLCFTPF